MPRPSSPVYAKASTNCPYLTLENPHHHRQACLAGSPSIYRWFGFVRIDHPRQVIKPTQLDNHCCDLIDRLYVDRQPRHRFLEPIHNVKDEAEASTAASRGSGFFIYWKDGGASRDRTDDLKLAKLALSQLSYGPFGSSLSDGGPRRS